MKRVQTKICGITTIEQGVTIANMGVDALGFILYPKSPRYITPEKLSQIICELPPFTKTVGVFVNEPVESLAEIVQTSGLDLVQLSGDESESYTKKLTGNKINWIQSLRIHSKNDLKQVESYSGRYLLLDAWSKDTYGGTGNTFNWNMLDGIRDRSRIILAGGLNPENIEDAIRFVQPFAVDVSSGVEVSAGIKDLSKVERLLEKINKRYANGSDIRL